MKISLVAAVADNRVIGTENSLPWSIPEDLKHFRAVTKGHTVLMGRETFESIGHPLPYRSNIVLTRDPNWSAPGVFVASDFATGVELAVDFPGELMVIGGGQIYQLALPFADQQILTLVHTNPVGDVFYPEYDPGDWQTEQRIAGQQDQLEYEFIWLSRVRGKLALPDKLSP